MAGVTFAEIEKEFSESLGYIRQDIRAVQGGKETINYTLALLVGCGCDALADAIGGKQPQDVFAKLLPPGDWRLLASHIFNAVRNGLAHRFDTKHLIVDGKIIQIYISWTKPDVVKIEQASTELRLFIGIQPLATGLCKKIDEFEACLKDEKNEPARRRFRDSYKSDSRKAEIKRKNEVEAWRRLMSAAGI